MPTVRIVRIAHRKYAGDLYSGRGGLHAPSRWAGQGRLVSYAAESLALAALEQIGRVGTLARLKEMVYVPAELDAEAILAPPLEDLPGTWNQRPPGDASRAYGDRWHEAKESVALRVPSVVLPEGVNYVLNPAHPDFGRALAVEEARPLRIDPRITDRLVVRA